MTIKNQIKHGIFYLTILLGVTCGLNLSVAANTVDNPRESIVLANKHIKASFMKDGNSCRMALISRKDDSDAVVIQSDEFEITLFDKSRFTVEHYLVEDVEYHGKELNVFYTRHSNTPKKAPEKVKVSYKIAEGPYIYKDVQLEMQKGMKVDRLQVMRFSTKSEALRGGFGQPVFIDNWFFGINYPCFYSRHSNNFTEPNFHYRWHFTIDLEGGDKEYAPREGLVSLFHFPGEAKQLGIGSWGIKGKQAVIGIAEEKEDGPELGLLDYINTFRKPSRSYLHFNNWYTPEAKAITVESFVNDVGVEIKSNLEKYGAKLDAMVPDDGWQKISGFKRIYEPQYDLTAINTELRKLDIDFGVWVAIDGTSTSVSVGEEIGYEIANPESFKKYQERTSYWGPQRYFNILNPKYQKDYKMAAKYLLEDCDVRYIKHDFNHMYTYNHLSERHAREACLDVTLDLIEYERQLNPKVLINYTNGTFFSPFWLLYMEYLWMNSGDTGTNTEIPQLCKLDDATSYRDNHFYRSFNNPEKSVRPIIPIADFMTHGILHATTVQYFTPDVDPIQDWLNYIVMYYGRGTLLKELYISPKMMTEEMWKALGTASAWAQKNEDIMRNSVLIGGDAGKGQVYGYISWQGDKAILTVRNPVHRPQELSVPFDATVYYRGNTGQPFRAKAIYPFVEEMPWKLTSGKTFSVHVPGNSVMVYELAKGKAITDSIITPENLPPITQAFSSESNYSITLQVPDEEFPHFELLLYHGKLDALAPSLPIIDGLAQQPTRSTKKGLIVTAHDLRKYRGKTITITGETPSDKEQVNKAWLVVDRKVVSSNKTISKNNELPWAIGQEYRRITKEVLFD